MSRLAQSLKKASQYNNTYNCRIETKTSLKLERWKQTSPIVQLNLLEPQNSIPSRHTDDVALQRSITKVFSLNIIVKRFNCKLVVEFGNKSVNLYLVGKVMKKNVMLVSYVRLVL